MPDGRHERSQATRTTLLGVSAALFARHGYEGVTLDEIARRAEVNKALVAYHFGGKPGLYGAVLREGIRVAMEELEPVRTLRAPAAERLAAYVDGFARFVSRAPHFVFMVLREEMAGGSNLEAGVLEEFVQLFALDRDIIRQGQREGVFRDVDPHETHLSLVGSIVFFVVSKPLRDGVQLPGVANPTPDLLDYVEHVKALFLNSLTRGGSPPCSRRKR